MGKRLLTEEAYSSIKFKARRTVGHLIICYPQLSGVRGQLTRLMTSVVQKPATRQVVGFRAQLTTHCSRRIAHFDRLQIRRNRFNVFVQYVGIAGI